MKQFLHESTLKSISKLMFYHNLKEMINLLSIVAFGLNVLIFCQTFELLLFSSHLPRLSPSAADSVCKSPEMPLCGALTYTGTVLMVLWIINS